LLPPRLQKALIDTCLDKHLLLLQYFFNDYETGYTPVDAIKRRVVTNLHYSTFTYGDYIFRQDFPTLGVVIIRENGVSVLGI
jgi:hypothetical protein